MPTVVDGDFEWDADKADENAVKHGVSFDEAVAAFGAAYSVDLADAIHPDRVVTLAMSPRGRILYIVSTGVGARTRIISARKATNHEERVYESGPRS